MSIEVDGRRQRGVATRAAILDAAELLFSEGGYHSTSLRSIAAAVGMSHAGVIKHYPTKGELLGAILQRIEAANARLALTLPADLSVADRVRLLTEQTSADTAATHLRVLLLGEATEEEHPAHGFVVGQLRAVESELGEAFGIDAVDLLALWNGIQVVGFYLPDIDAVGIGQTYLAGLDRPAAEHPAAQVSAVIKRAPTAPPETREQQIVWAATAAFARNGYRATSLREIATDLRLSHGTVLYHFPSKVRLLTAVLDLRDRDESLPWSWDTTPLDYLNGMYLQAIHNRENPALGRLFSTLVCEAVDTSHPAHEYFRSRYARFRAELHGVLSSLASQGLLRDGLDLDAETVILIALWEGLGLRDLYLDDERGLPERVRARLNSLLTVQLGRA